MLKTLVFACLFLLLATPSQAQEFKGSYKDWGLFVTKEGKNNVCYITSNPSKKAANIKGRGDVYMLVTYRGSGTAEVSVNSGYNYKEGTEVDFIINGKSSYNFFTSSKTPQMAWARDEKMDGAAINSMKKGDKVEIKGVSEKGTRSTDIYSLKGFGLAYDKMISSCGKPAEAKPATKAPAKTAKKVKKKTKKTVKAKQTTPAAAPANAAAPAKDDSQAEPATESQDN